MIDQKYKKLWKLTLVTLREARPLSPRRAACLCASIGEPTRNIAPRIVVQHSNIVVAPTINMNATVYSNTVYNWYPPVPLSFYMYYYTPMQNLPSLF